MDLSMPQSFQLALHVPQGWCRWPAGIVVSRRLGEATSRNPGALRGPGDQRGRDDRGSRGCSRELPGVLLVDLVPVLVQRGDREPGRGSELCGGHAVGGQASHLSHHAWRLRA